MKEGEHRKRLALFFFMYYLKETPVFTGIFDLLHYGFSLLTIELLQADNREVRHF